MTHPEWLAGIREREAKAMPGPWGMESGTYGERITYEDQEYDYPRRKFTAFLGQRDKLSDSYNFWYSDAKFISHARQDIPKLLGYVDELSACADADKRIIAQLENQLWLQTEKMNQLEKKLGIGETR